jgi:hypothetical protein
MFKDFCSAAAAGLLLAHCAGTAVKVMPGYTSMNVGKSKLGIVILRDNLAIADSLETEENPGGGDTKQRFGEFLTSQLREFAEHDGKFAEVIAVSGCETSGLTRISDSLSSDRPVSMRVPAQKAFISDGLPYLLILDSVNVSREKKVGKTVVVIGPNGMMAPKRTGDSDRLTMKGTFVLWDNLAGKTAAFGRINEKTDVLFNRTKNALLAIVKHVSSDIFSDQPYGVQTAPPR